jgi:hypothetical protein
MRLNYINNFYYTWAAVAVGGVSLGTAVYKGLHASSQDRKAKREGEAAKRPFYSIPSEDLINRNIAGSMAEQGLSSAEKQYAGEQRERGLATSTHALSETGAGVNQFGELNQVFSDSLKSQSALDAQEHKQNIDFFTKANSEISAQKGIQFGINELQPYESKLKEIQDRRTAAQTNENNAVNEGIGSASAIATGVNSYLKQPPKTPPANGDWSKVTDWSKVSTPYNRTFGLENTGATSGASPADAFGSIDPNSWNPGAMASLPDSSDNS